MPKAHEITHTLPPKVLLFGPVGSGKTALTMTLGERLQLIDCDGGFMTGVRFQDAFTPQRRLVDIVQCYEDNPMAVAVAYMKVKAHLKMIYDQCQLKRYPFQAVALDNLTALVDFGIHYICGNSGSPWKNPQIQEWGMLTNEVDQIIALIKIIPLPFILIAHCEYNPFQGVNRAEISVPTKRLPLKVPGGFDEIWFTHVETIAGTNHYKVRTEQTVDIVARTRLGLPKVFDQNLGMVEILKKGGYTFPEPAVASVSSAPATTVAPVVKP